MRADHSETMFDFWKPYVNFKSKLSNPKKPENTQRQAEEFVKKYEQLSHSGCSKELGARIEMR